MNYFKFFYVVILTLKINSYLTMTVFLKQMIIIIIQTGEM